MEKLIFLYHNRCFMKKLIIIAAIGKNNELGYKNDLIWKLKGDMKFFKENTINHHVVMGENTFYSLPKKLENRIHIVLSFDGNFDDDIIVVRSIDEFFDVAKNIDDDIYVIGGASIYNQFINYADELFLTHIESESKADVYFPDFNEYDYDVDILEEKSENNINYKHVLYKKKH